MTAKIVNPILPTVASVDDEGLMVPPWLKYPHIKLGSIGWRMGYGEDYWFRFRAWLKGMPKEIADAVRAKYPEPFEWTGFYAIGERK